MDSRFWSAVLAICAALTLVSGAFADPPKPGGVKVGEVGGWNVEVTAKIDDLKGFFNDVSKFASAAWKKVFTRHATKQQVFTIDGKHVVAVPVSSGAGGTRLTYNINFDPAWTRKTWVHVIVANVPAGLKAEGMVFQQKYDADWGSDPNIGPHMKHGDRVLFEPGHGRYMASRSNEKYWGSVILFVEDGLTLDQLNQLPHLKVSKPAAEPDSQPPVSEQPKPPASDAPKSAEGTSPESKVPSVPAK